MSNIIPMVSSSPPPLDEAPSFSEAWGGDDDDDDDFGNFTGADTSTDVPDYSQCALPSPYKETHTFSEPPSKPVEVNGSEKFTSNPPEAQKKPLSLDLPHTTTECLNDNQMQQSNNTQDNLDVSRRKLSQNCEESLNSKRESTTDSGMCSTEISPVQISDELCDSKSVSSEADEMFTEVESSVQTPHDHELSLEGVSQEASSSETTGKAEEEKTQNSVSREKEEWSDFSEVANSAALPISEHYSSKHDGTVDATISNEDESEHLQDKQSKDLAPQEGTEDKSSEKDCSREDSQQDTDTEDNFDTCIEFETFKIGEQNHESDDLDLPPIKSSEEEDEISSEKVDKELSSVASSNEWSEDNAEESEDQTEGTEEKGESLAEGNANTVTDNTFQSETGFAAFQNDNNNGFVAFADSTQGKSDNWADFASHSNAIENKTDSMESVETEQKPTDSDDVNENDDFGEFGDFNDFADFTTGPTQTESDLRTGANDDFKSATSDSQDEFGDFLAPDSQKGFSSQKSSASVHSANTKMSHLKSPGTEKIGCVLSSCFPAEPTDLLTLGQIMEVLDAVVEKALSLPKLPQSLSKSKISESCKAVENIWEYLRDIEKSTAGKYQWAESSGNKKLFKTLKIDARNVLMWGVKKPGIPLFAANLGLLEPTREDQRHTEDSKKIVTSLVDTTKSDTTTTLPQEIPPAQFDWSGSGLTNPLDAKSTLLDLDLLAVNDGKSADVKGKVFESDLLGGSEAQKVKPKTLKPLEMVLASMKFNPTIKQRKVDENLGEEAARIIGSLPDLSFMQAKVLMFPVRTLAEGEVNGES